jgi:hypothetical protein
MFHMVAEILKTKVGAQSGARQQALITQQVRMARLQMGLRAMVRLWEEELDLVWEKVTGGIELREGERAGARMVAAQFARVCDDIANELAVSVGSRSIFNASPVQRFRRDINALATHAFFDHDHLASLYGRTLLGLDLPSMV